MTRLDRESVVYDSRLHCSQLRQQILSSFRKTDIITHELYEANAKEHCGPLSSSLITFFVITSVRLFCMLQKVY